MTNEERKQRIESYGNAHNMLVEAVKQFPQAMWQFKPAPNEFSIHEIIVHIADSEANSFIRARRAIAEPGSGVLGYDEMVWAKGLRYHAQSADDALELFKWLRGNTHKLIGTLSDATWAHTFEHSEIGVVTLEQWLDMYERHVPEHVEQMQKVYAAWRSR